MQTKTINLSKSHLTKFQILSLKAGPKICLTTKENVFDIKSSFKEFTSKSKLRETDFGDTKLKKVFDKCKVIYALKQPKNLLCLLSKPKVQNCIFKKYGFYRYKCKDSRCSLCS